MKKTILILGASGGIGKDLTKFLASENLNLALHYFKNKPTQIPESATVFQADLTNEIEIEGLISAVIETYESIDYIIHSAGISKNDISWKANTENWNATIALNLTAPFLVSKYALPFMRQNNFGRIIFISSVVAQMGMAGTSAYAASKAGLFGLTKTLAKETANKNITVNAIALGYFNAGMIEDVPDHLRNEIIESIPVKRLGETEELHHLIQYIINDKAGYFTGQTVNLNGGLINS